MHSTRGAIVAIASVMFGVASIGCDLPQGVIPSSVAQAASADADKIPTFAADYSWPKPLPNNWVLGNIAGLYVDKKNDHVWIIQRPSTLSGPDVYAQLDPPAAQCCRAAPPIIEFDSAGNIIQTLGGPNPKNPGEYEWPREHALFVDPDGNIWTGSDENKVGAGSTETHSATVTKLSPSGKLIFQKGKFGQSKGNADTENFGSPAGVFVDAKANEVFVADGYHNNRIIVIDATTGAFKRTWGAYGNKPADGDPPYDATMPPSQQFRHPVHCVELSRDDLVYVCDRRSNRIQVFHKDGTFVREGFVAPWTLGFGAVHDIAFSPDPGQRFLYVGDGANRKVWIVRRDDLKVLGSFGRGGRGAGEFGVVHTLDTDSKGNLYIGDTVGFNRVQKFAFKGLSPSPK